MKALHFQWVHRAPAEQLGPKPPLVGRKSQAKPQEKGWSSMPVTLVPVGSLLPEEVWEI